jgi:hypothetical protein
LRAAERHRRALNGEIQQGEVRPSMGSVGDAYNNAMALRIVSHRVA